MLTFRIASAARDTTCLLGSRMARLSLPPDVRRDCAASPLPFTHYFLRLRQLPIGRLVVDRNTDG